MTKNQLISDIILRITAGKPSDDLEIEPSQVAFWINIVRDAIVKAYLDDKVEEGLSIDDYFVIQESCKPLNSETDPSIDDDKERIYIRLKKVPMEVYKDRAVVRVITNEGSFINKGRLSTIDTIHHLNYAKPSITNLVYYRDGKTKLVIEGIPLELRDVVEIIVWYVPKEDLLCLADDDEVSIPNELLPEILQAVEDIARRELYGPEDKENDGDQDIPVENLNG